MFLTAGIIILVIKQCQQGFARASKTPATPVGWSLIVLPERRRGWGSGSPPSSECYPIVTCVFLFSYCVVGGFFDDPLGAAQFVVFPDIIKIKIDSWFR